MIELQNKYVAYLEKHRHDEISPEILFQRPYQLLRENYSDKDLRADGVFFSSTNVANSLISKLGIINTSDNVLDPCCGAGDLLLAYVSKLPHFNDPIEAIKEWANILYGNDINADLVEAFNPKLQHNSVSGQPGT